MWNGLTELQEEFIRETMHKAAQLGITCSIICSNGQLSNGHVIFDGNINADLISVCLKSISTHQQAEPGKPIFADIFKYAKNTNADQRGWVPLFNEENEGEDGRWYMRVFPSSDDIELHRKEDGIIKYIANLSHCKADGNSLMIRRVYDDNQDLRTYHPGFASMNADITLISDETWDEWLGSYGLPIRDVLINLLTMKRR